MGSLYKKPVMITDPATGRQVKGKSRKWWGQYKDASGRLRRHPLSIDKMAAKAMLSQILRRVEREKAGLVDPTDEQRKRPLKKHLAEFKSYLQNRGVGAQHSTESVRQIERMVAACKWKLVADISASSALAFLGDLRRAGRSAQTYNHYLKSARQFTRWLVRDQRAARLTHAGRYLRHRRLHFVRHGGLGDRSTERYHSV